jgi:hypothetical protein
VLRYFRSDIAIVSLDMSGFIVEQIARQHAKVLMESIIPQLAHSMGKLHVNAKQTLLGMELDVFQIVLPSLIPMVKQCFKFGMYFVSV